MTLFESIDTLGAMMRWGFLLVLTFVAAAAFAEPATLPATTQAVRAHAVQQALTQLAIDINVAMGKIPEGDARVDALIAARRKCIATLKRAQLTVKVKADASDIRAEIDHQYDKLSELVKGLPLFTGVLECQSVVYVCDATGTMQGKMPGLKRELIRSVNALEPSQFFNIIFFQGDHVIPLEKSPVPAVDDTKKRLPAMLKKIDARESTDPYPALRAAFAMKPDIIYLITDGFDQMEKPEFLTAEFARLNPNKKIHVHTLYVSQSDREEPRDKPFMELLERVAKENGGTFLQYFPPREQK